MSEYEFVHTVPGTMLSVAQKQAESLGFRHRLLSVDGVPVEHDTKFDWDRVGFCVRNNIVEAARVG